MSGSLARLTIDVRPRSAIVVLDKKRLRQIMRRAGAEVAASARRMLRRSAGGGRFYHTAMGRHQASAPGEAPASLTGQLARSIRVRVSRSALSVEIKATMYYALFLEHGAQGGGGRRKNRNKRGKPSTRRVLQPRPFLTTALAAAQNSLAERIKAAILQDIEFRRLKP